MTRKRIRLVFLLLVLCKCAVSDIIDDVLNNEEPCAAVCDKTYSLITNVKHSTCCRRGCRFFTLMGVVLDSQEDLNATKDACQASCMEAYRHTRDRYACNIGCASMASIAQRRYQLSEEVLHHGLKESVGLGDVKTEEGVNGKIVDLRHWAFHLIIRHRRPPSAPSLPPPQELFPSPGFPGVCSKKVSRVSNCVSGSFLMANFSNSTHRPEDDSKVSSRNVGQNGATNPVGNPRNLWDPAYDVLTDPGLRPQLRYPLFPPQARASLPHTHVRTLPGPLPAPLDDPLSPPSSPTSPDDDLSSPPWGHPWEAETEESEASRDWFGCMARRAGLPRWFLPAVALSALVTAAWLCFAPDRVRLEYKKGQTSNIEAAKEDCKISAEGEEDFVVKVPLLSTNEQISSMAPPPYTPKV